MIDRDMKEEWDPLGKRERGEEEHSNREKSLCKGTEAGKNTLGGR